MSIQRPTITAAALIDALRDKGYITDDSLVSLLGTNRHNPDLNVLELALETENVLSRDELLETKAEVSGLPALTDPTVTVAPHLNPQLSRRLGALVLNRAPLTIAMVEDTTANLQALAAAAGTDKFEVWLITAAQFAALWRATYAGAALDSRPPAPDLFTVLDHAVNERASDVHLKVGVSPVLRVDGAMRPLEYQPLTESWMRTQIHAIAQRRHLEDLERKFSTDFAYTFGKARFRVNAARDAHGHTMVLRKLPSQIPSFDDLGAPPAIRRFAQLERGMVLVTGPTGSGKSTTLAGILNEIITTSSRHVITLEDPIEFRLPTDRPSLVNQRELGSSFNSFTDGLRDALRQDPDVILVGEMRDKETIKAALTAAETGHLVFGTLHTINAPQTVARIVNSFGAEEQDAIRAQLAQMLKGVVSQTLLPRASATGRVAAYEIMVSTPAIATNLRKVDGANQLKQTMQTAAKDGMQTIEMSLAQLVHAGLVRQDEAEFRAHDLEEFRRQLDFIRSHR
jgi:twitching motility protein PilT